MSIYYHICKILSNKIAAIIYIYTLLNSTSISSSAQLEIKSILIYSFKKTISQ